MKGTAKDCSKEPWEFDIRQRRIMNVLYRTIKKTHSLTSSLTTFLRSKIKNEKKKLKLLEWAFICDQPELSSITSLDAAPVWMQKGQKHDSQKWQKWELRFRPFCIQTGAASKLIKLESCGWSQMKEYSKSFNFFFLFLIFDHGKVVKLDVNECVFFIVWYSILT